MTKKEKARARPKAKKSPGKPRRIDPAEFLARFPSPDRRPISGHLAIHPLADLLPPMTEQEFEALKGSIQNCGQVEDVILLDGKILDGRHRHRAAVELKIPTWVRDYAGPMKPIEFVYSKAVHRNLTDSQKACAAIAISDEFAREAAKRQTAGAKADEAVKGKAVDQAGDLFGVSGKYVQYAKLLKKHDEKLFEKVFNGTLKLSVAISEIRRRVKQETLARKAAELPAVAGTEQWEIRRGDSLSLMKSGGIACRYYRLAFADPPYNIGIDYGSGDKADLLPRDKYLDWCESWIDGLPDVLTDDGSAWVMINHENAATLEIMLTGVGFTVRSWITWYETFGVNCANNFNRTSRRILYCVKDPRRFVFHADAVNRPSDRQSKYNDKRAAPGGKILDDVWIVPRLVDNAKERVPGFPTQVPEEIMRRIIGSCTDPGDRVIDIFNGSGTTVAVAARLGRPALGIDKSAKFVEASRRRVQLAFHEGRKP